MPEWPSEFRNRKLTEVSKRSDKKVDLSNKGQQSPKRGNAFVSDMRWCWPESYCLSSEVSVFL